LVIAAVCAVAIAAAWGYLRLRRLSLAPGTFDCAWRVGLAGQDETERWAEGLGEYHSDRLVWWRVYSLSGKPQKVWLRPFLELVDRTPLTGAQTAGLYLVRCTYHGELFEMMMSAEAYHGLSSWIESAPPNMRGFVL